MVGEREGRGHGQLFSPISVGAWLAFPAAPLVPNISTPPSSTEKGIT